jgi:A/G-specific adenine glycosylase
MRSESQRLADFQAEVLSYYQTHGRHDLPWRLPLPDGSFDPYAIMVSEIMLQQTQVSRVTPKFLAFMQAFPTTAALARASLGEVLQMWSGLGYNRRAKFLWQAAIMVEDDFGGQLPQTTAALVRLPGVGLNTAGAVLAYAFNKPVVFVETNIRTVFIHYFFGDQTAVPDRLIADMVSRALPDNPREWYWALMDYGSYLKQSVGNVSRASAHYTRQSVFQGSRRQIRGQVLKSLASQPQTATALAAHITDERLPAVLDDLVAEGLVQKRGSHFSL